MTVRNSRALRQSGPPPGLTVGGYSLVSRLGEGGMGVVHLAQARDGSRVALKVLRPQVVGDDETRARLAREVDSLTRVRSPRVAEIIDADPWGPVPFVATRYVPGLSLHDHVAQEGPIGGPDLAHLALGLAEALAAVHRVGVLHRDIKPSNVLLEGRNPVLIDFGLARVADDAKITQTGWLIGTPGYLAPEILYGIEPTPASDVHSWAATVAFAGTGHPPFGRGPSAAVMDRVRRGEHDLSGLDGWILELVDAALHPDPARRPSLDQVIDDLSGLHTRQRPLRGLAEPTRLLRSPGEPGDAGSEDAADPAPAVIVAKVSLAERARRTSLGLMLAAVVAVGIVAAPYATSAAVAGGVLLFRWAWVTRSGSRARRLARGRRWYDGVLAALSTPVTLVTSLPGTLMLLVWTALLVASAGLVCFAVEVPVTQALAGLGVMLAVVVWTGPGASRLREPLRALARPVARSGSSWWVAMTGLAVAVGVLAWWVATSGPVWSPAGGPLW